MLKGQLGKILTQKENDWGRYKIIDEAGRETLAVGVIPDASIGMTVSLDGVEENSQYGKQYKIHAVLKAARSPFAGARRFLADGYIKGIGPSKADAIIGMFGKDAPNLFDTAAGREKLCLAKGLSHRTIENALPSYDENKKYKDIIMFLNGSGTKVQVEKIYECYGDNAISILKQNPYRLQMDIDGFGFHRADEIALASGIKADSLCRLIAAITYFIETAQTNDGHCYVSVEDIYGKVATLLTPMPKFEDITDKVVSNAIREWSVESREKLIKAHDPSIDTLKTIEEVISTRRLIAAGLSDALENGIEDGSFVNDDGKIYTAAMYEREVNICDMITKMIHQNPVRFIPRDKIEASIKTVEKRKTAELRAKNIDGDFITTDEQRNAVFLGLMHRISVISGGPGRGKTAISEIIADAFLNSGAYYDTNDILMLAPTGRAAQRMTESTGYPAMTAQRAVISVKCGKNAYPSGKLIIVDEASMIDMFLMESLLGYAKNCNIIFVGDVDQIASVGPGKILKDMIDSGKVPCILLSEGHRNSGTIATNSYLIKDGRKLKDYVYDEHFVYIPSSIEHIRDIVINDYIAKIQQYGIQNVMLCAAMRVRGVVSVNALNSILQEKLTKGRKQAVFGDGKIFRVGDRVMQIHNDYKFVIKRSDRYSEGIFNGERGTVADVIYDPIEDGYKLVVLFDDGSIGEYTSAAVENLVLAYANTLHKCQGSESECMMMVYTFGDYMLLKKSLFYTGETRAKKEFRFYGEEQYRYGGKLSAFDVAVGRTDDEERNTTLAARLKLA